MEDDSEQGEQVRFRIVNALGYFYEAKVVPSLILALTDSSRLVRMAASDAIFNLADQGKHNDQLISTLREQASHPLINALNDNDDVVRRSAALVLEFLEVIDPVIQSLDHSNAHVREASARILGNLKVVKAEDRLVHLLEDPIRFVRESAQEALDLIHSDEED